MFHLALADDTEVPGSIPEELHGMNQEGWKVDELDDDCPMLPNGI